MQFRDVAEFLREQTDRVLLLRLVEGNYGDELERMGLRKRLRECNVDFVEVRFGGERLEELLSKFDVICFYGVGGIGEVYRSFSNRVNQLCTAHPNKLFVIAPTTAMLHEEFLRERYLHDNLVFFAREPTTYSFMRYLGVKRCFLDKCMALHITAEELPGNQGVKWKTALFRREDVERIDATPPRDFEVMLDPVLAADSFEEWVNLHRAAETIYTNRLHSGICGMILGKRVYLFRNSYHKLRSVWKYSLKRKGVFWLNV